MQVGVDLRRVRAIKSIIDFVLTHAIAGTLIGALLTMLGTLLMMRRQALALQTQVALEFFRRYADISKAMPDHLRFAKYPWNNSPPSEEEYRKIIRSMIEYGNLCSEEFALRQKRRIPKDLWEVWVDGIRENFEAEIWAAYVGRSIP